MFTNNTVLHRQSCLLGSRLQQRTATVAPGRRCLRTLAERKGGIDFRPSRASETGYMKKDSAGQENIFAVESKSFVGSKDQATNTAANAAYAGLAAALAALAIAGGIFLTKDNAAVPPAQVLKEAPKESLSSISKRLAPVVKEAVMETPAAPLVADE